MTKKILFAGTPEIAVPTLRALCSNFDVVGVLTSVDKAVGRSSQLVPSPVKVAAIELGIPVLQYESLKTEAREAVSGLGANILVSFAYGKIFGPKFLRLFEGSYNIHPSALPLMRGPSPIQETLLSGLKKCTISFQNLGEKMDEGEVWDTLEFDLSGKETDQSLNEIVGKKAGPFAVETLENIFEENLVCKAQEGEVTYCKMIQKEDGVLDFTSTAFENHCRIRSFYPWPKAWTKVNGKDIAITGVWGGFEE
ncbi:MAG: methionyl-tRNA formyltransferase, partial [Sphaerochaetaceae bacterium]|nr:methionyl-tRNA formyltransferase [Sphaerochaetaceae bacterium]